MSSPQLDEMHGQFRENFLSDEQFKDEFQRATEGLLPEVGDSDLMPKLLTLHIAEFDPIRLGIDYHVLAFDDFDDSERRHHYVRMLGERQAIEKRNVLMAIMASEVWMSANMYRADGTRRYEMPSDDPKRKEAISVFAVSLDGRTALAQCMVTRTIGGKFKTFGKLQMAYSFEKSKMSEMKLMLLDEFWHGYMVGCRDNLGL